MKKIIVVSLLICALVSCKENTHRTNNTIKAVSSKTSTLILEQLKNPTENHVLAVAHRGDWRNAPENSIDAINRALKMGIDIVEIDVRKTKDNHLIVMHDKSVDRTTTGKGKIAEIKLDSIQKLVLKNGAGMPTKHKVPTLKEVMNFVKGKPVLLNLDKAWDNLPESFAILKETGTINQAIFKGNDPLHVMQEKHGKLMDSIHYMPMVWPINYNIYGETAEAPDIYAKGFIDNYKPIAFEVIYDKEDSPVIDGIALMKKEKITVWVNTLWDELCAGHTDDKALENPEAHWGWIIEKGANVIQTDRPKELLEYLRKKQLHN
ncbi:glycerophosphodiester phosphodiesterase family protein [Flavivirga spongiicola]|uniref:Glycerophosphodiester phosphodiesterase family protein n=1 Tax=Flavivirga spongiicola TaxID=421621 RepID=A0ABU7XRR7_9FLAO|nr:glycerophosphodiester phosphodiesterase family protein [Flavivirga sp. MEBiC05379]MDO5978226.1 glycerophosphodiester phosphodiesterase family protein [Flavivirga sp. MEBiC05379]